MNTTNRQRASTLAGLAALTLGLGFAATSASAADREPNRTVKFSDLDLTKPAGVQELYSRIQSAAAIVCGGRDPVVTLYVRKTRCFGAAVTQAVATVDNPRLSALHGAELQRLAKN
jgi:UrcA family protein